MSQSLVLVGEPTRIAHVWRIIDIGHHTHVISHWMIYNKHMVHGNDQPQPFKVIERNYKIWKIISLPN